jgi:PA domain
MVDAGTNGCVSVTFLFGTTPPCWVAKKHNKNSPDMRTLLLLATLALFQAAQAQVVFLVLEPTDLSGSYERNLASTDDGWAVPDMTDPANSVTGQVVLVDNGTAADSLGCDTVVNGGEVAGNIALIYRGSCEFGDKAFHAQEAGAIGAIIVNNEPGTVLDFGMLGGDFGMDVTIPVIMITQETGAMIRSEVDAGNLVAYIGVLNGAFANNLGMYAADVLIPQGALPVQLAQNPGEYSFVPGTWVHNYGTGTQQNVVLSATFEQTGT